MSESGPLVVEEETARWMTAFYAGEEAAFERLWQHWQARLLRFFLRQGWSLQDAEDLTQDTFVSIYSTKYRATARYDSTRPFANWLYRIALNMHANEHRRGRRRPRA